MHRAVRGDLVTAPSFGVVDILKDVVIVTARGKICGLAQNSAGAERLDKGCKDLLAQSGIDNEDSLMRLKEGEVMMPGFIDLHVHAPQYTYSGTATDRPLMEWLDYYAFPRESKQDDSADAQRMKVTATENQLLVKRLISSGTTTALYFGTLNIASTLRFAEQVVAAGQRAFIGKVCMDRNSPENYIASTEDNIADSETFIKTVRSWKSDLVEPVITPRFVPSCSVELLQGLGHLAAKHKVAVQSHISESLDEVAFCKALHPEVDGRDTPIFEEAGLLTSQCVMAHGVCLTDEELGCFAKHGSAIAHCPLSNFYFADVLLHVKHCLARGVKVGLGTDVAGGYSYSMLSAIRNAVIASKALRMQKLANTPGASLAEVEKDLVNWKEAFYLATMGGAQALEIQDTTGSLEVGKDFDCVVVDCGHFSASADDSSKSRPYDVFPEDTDLDRFEKYINLGDDRNVRSVFVKGNLIKAA